MENLIREVWKKKATGIGFEPKLVQAYGERFSEGITKGYGKDLFEIDFNTPDYNKLKNLHIDAWKFASAKANTQLNELSKALVKPDGTLRTFEEFRIQSVIITGKHLSGLKAEYNTAVASAQMASKWETIQQQKEIFPYLQFVAVEDTHTTALCRSLDGVIRHVDNPFWEKYYPPNHYNCRSTVRQLRKAPEGQEGGAYSTPNFPREFETNLAKHGHIFPPEHNYYKGIDPNELFNKVREYLPYDLQFDRLDEQSNRIGIPIRTHYNPLVLKGPDFPLKIQVVEEMKPILRLKNVDLLPEVTGEKPHQRKIILPEIATNNNPDFRFYFENDKQGILYELKNVTNALNENTLRRAMNKAGQQANYLIINMNALPSLHDLYRMANGRFIQRKNLQQIWFRFNGEYHTISRGDRVVKVIKQRDTT